MLLPENRERAELLLELEISNNRIEILEARVKSLESQFPQTFSESQGDVVTRKRGTIFCNFIVSASFPLIAGVYRAIYKMIYRKNLSRLSRTL